MACRKPPEQSLARGVPHLWMAEMPKEAYKAYEESPNPVINRRSWVRVVCAGIRSGEIGEGPEGSGDRHSGSDESQEGAQQARQEARNEIGKEDRAARNHAGPKQAVRHDPAELATKARSTVTTKPPGNL